MSATMMCTQCGTVAAPKTYTKGSLLIEMLLWTMCFPGLIYSVWRLTSRCKVCPACKSNAIIPMDSPMARNR